MTGKEVQTRIEVITMAVSPVLDSALGRSFPLKGTFSAGFQKKKKSLQMNTLHCLIKM